MGCSCYYFRMPARWKWLVAGAGVFFLAVLIHGTLQQTKHRYEACVSFGGRMHCATAEGGTPEEAISAARIICCTVLASGRDENIRCLEAPLLRVRPITQD
jgi:hypothetical protein